MQCRDDYTGMLWVWQAPADFAVEAMHAQRYCHFNAGKELLTWTRTYQMQWLFSTRKTSSSRQRYAPGRPVFHLLA